MFGGREIMKMESLMQVERREAKEMERMLHVPLAGFATGRLLILHSSLCPCW